MKAIITDIRKIHGFGVTAGDVRETDFNAQVCATSNLSDEDLIRLMKAAPDLLDALKNILRSVEALPDWNTDWLNLHSDDQGKLDPCPWVLARNAILKATLP